MVPRKLNVAPGVWPLTSRGPKTYSGVLVFFEHFNMQKDRQGPPRYPAGQKDHRGLRDDP